MICHGSPLVVSNELQSVHTLLQIAVRKVELIQGILDDAAASAVRRDQDTLLNDGRLVLVDPVVARYESVLLWAALLPILTEIMAYAAFVVFLVVDAVLGLILDELARVIVLWVILPERANLPKAIIR